jgi:hypothetical protein
MELGTYALYVGLGLGAGSTTADTPKVDGVVRRDTSSAVASGFVGVRRGRMEFEGGILSLPKYKGYAYISDYLAYRRANFNEIGPGPASAEGVQRITSRAYYVRLSASGPDLRRITPYAFVGLARVRTSNTEDSTYFAPDETLHFHIALYQWACYCGIGLNTSVSQRLSIRAEAGYIPGAVQAYWTGKRDIRMGTLSARWLW